MNEDKRTVKLILESDDIIEAVSMGVFNIADDSDTPNVLTWQVVPLALEPLGDSVFINNAGESFENFWRIKFGEQIKNMAILEVIICSLLKAMKYQIRIKIISIDLL